MKGELKAGGLALVVNAYDKSVIGKCVTLSRLISPGDHFTAPGGVKCRWLSHYPPAWLVTGDIHSGSMSSSMRYYGWAVFRPTDLLPIDDTDPDSVDELIKDKPVEVTA